MMINGISWFECQMFFFLMIRRPPRSTQSRSSAASDVYKRQGRPLQHLPGGGPRHPGGPQRGLPGRGVPPGAAHSLSLIHISEPTRPY